ncbi:Rne/Rng family ribonuclease [Flavimaricola marinus]|uniref:Ribonuclease E n=1 Tax=Flavimaricola marinus TaxID=1819565 RepID=A0A238LD36_9RHOB|nr:ribonuclease E/G [Flavimaricola marinus]SMY07637.1 Ribonuclease E [Flavimaricola marinus]
MAKKMLIDATHAEETRVVVVDGNKVEEFDFESASRRQLAGNIYLAKVTRVEPSLQAAFVDYGGNRHGFLAFSEIHPDYYQIPVADREALLEEERALAASEDDGNGDEASEGAKPKRVRRSRSRSRSKAAETGGDAVATADVSGMETIDLDEDDDGKEDRDAPEGSSPMELVAETPVETPAAGEDDDSDATDDADLVVAQVDKDETIESVADEDDSEDVRPVRKARPKRYKIQEVVKVRQIMLVQVVKEERGNKGAALTTYLSLAGRYCVLMPNTARGGGISRKITNIADRKKLKEIASHMEVPQGAGLIIRTAGSQRTKAEIKRDYEYLQRLWEQIRELTLKSIAPAKIYEEGDLIKRSIRDLYSKEIDEVIVEGAEGYRTAKDFMKMIMPSHAKNVKPYMESLPLFARHQVEGYLAGMFNPTVQLPSGGYIVIGVTEALVAIDVNSGRATKEGSIEQTALKTNLEASDEVARQLRLRDLAGLIVIDYIDMDERKNNAAVEKRLKDKLKTDRARIQVGRISGFGLMEMSRQRLRPGMLEATTQPCPHCHGTGLLRSDDNVALAILRQLEEEGVRGRSKEVLVKVPYGIMNFLMNYKREHVAQIEMRYGMAVRVEGDPALVSPDFTLEKFKTATRTVPEAVLPVVSTSAMMFEDEDDDVVEADEDEAPDTAVAEPVEPVSADAPGPADGDDRPRKKRRRRRRRRGGNGESNGESNGDNGDDSSSASDASEGAETAEVQAEAKAEVVSESKDEPAAETAEATEKPKRRRSRRRKVDSDAEAEQPETAEPAAEATATESDTAATDAKEEAPKPRRRSRAKKPVADAAEAETSTEDASTAEADAPAEKPAAKPRRSRAKPKAAPVQEAPVEEAPAEPAVVEAPEVNETAAEPAPEPAAAPVVEEVAETLATTTPDEAETTPEPATTSAASQDEATSDKPKRRGWWSLSR